MDQARSSGFWDGGSKVMFMMGLFLGIAVSSTLGLGLIVGGVIGGAGKAATVAVAPTPSPSPTPSPTPAGGPVKPVGNEDHIKGNKDAKVTLIEYSDFECPFCKRFEPSVKQALKDFPKDVRLIYRHFPLRSLHPSAQKAAEASECAAKLGGNDAFWKMHEKLIAMDPMSTDLMKQAAKDIGLDQGKFNTCLDNGETAARVNQDFNEGGAAGVEGTPATFINGQLVSGAIPYDGPQGLKELIQQAGASK